MKIIILGAGRTGSSVARHLASEDNDVVVVDVNPALLQELQDRVDISTATGPGPHPGTLESADAASADLLVAVMPRDEDNMIACQIAWSLYKLPLKIARIRDTDYLSHEELFNMDNIPIDVVIRPEALVTRYVQSFVEYPGANLVHDFADGAAQLVSVTVQPDAKALGYTVRKLHEKFPLIRVLGLYRDGKLVIPDADSVIEEQDQVYYVSPPQLTVEIKKKLRKPERPYKRVILAGGGHIGKRVALALQHNFKVKVVEKSAERAAQIAPLLEKTIVLSADATDRDLLVAEGIADTDVFCAITSEDEANILSCMLAKRLGARKTFCLVNKPTYVDMIQGGSIDIAFSPDKITAGSILRYARRGNVQKVYPLHESGAEVLEAVAQGEEGASLLVGRRIEQIDMPDGVVLGAIIRYGLMIPVHHDSEIEDGDHLIMLLRDKSLLNTLVSYFQAES